MNAVWYNAIDVYIQESGSWTGWSNEDVRCLLLKGETTTPDNPDHDFVNDIVADESAATDYARQTLASVAFAVDATNNRCELTFDPVDFGTVDAAGSAEAYVGMILYIEGASDAARRLICGFSLPSLSPNGTGFVLSPGSEGAVQVAIGTLS